MGQPQASSSHSVHEPDCLELVMVDNKGIQDFLMQRANSNHKTDTMQESMHLKSSRIGEENLSAKSYDNINLADQTTLSPQKLGL
jgi:uncharacterized protein (UPF0210 family)